MSDATGVMVYELRDSESGSVENDLESGEVWNVTKKYLIGQCFGGMGQVKDAIAPYVPRYWQSPSGYWRRKSLSIKGVGKACYECEGSYTTLVPVSDGGDKAKEPDGQGDFVPGAIAWDTTGATEHITSAIDQRVQGSSDFFEGAINISGTSVQGMDVVVPSMKYSETWIMPAAVGMSAEYVKNIYQLTGTVNELQFRAFEPGEALFLGARAQWSGDQPYVAVTFDFHARANNSDFQVVGLSGFLKEGWEYPNVIYEPAISGTNMLVQRPRCCVINTVYKKKDWTALNITKTQPGVAKSISQAQAASKAAAVTAFFQR